ncbi:MAG: PDZ domain-containing protein [Fibrobacter sp.]|nr:PDZ domain-containing protein [Fibrobacter sp.]
MEKFWIASLLASVKMLLAAESFGGIGLAVYPSEFGAEVARVVHGSVAEKAGIAVGDFLLSANGIPLEGESLEYDMEVLRGNPGEKLEVVVLRGNETLSFDLKREKIVVKSDGESVLDKKNEKLVFLDDVELANVNAKVYTLESATDKETSSESSGLSAFSRTEILLNLENSGTTEVNVLTAKGEKIQTFQMEAVAGKNSLEWNGQKLPRGSYFVQVSQNGKNFHFKGTLK